MGCCGGGHNSHSQMRAKDHGSNHNQECTNNGASKMMIIFGLILFGSMIYYFLR